MDSKNTIAAIALSSAVIVLWALFFVPEKSTVDQNIVEKEKIEQSGDAPSLEQKETQIAISRGDALKQSERIQFENNNIIGSISLKGASIDDLTFKNYKIKVDDEEKPLFASLLPEQQISTISVEDALKLFDLPVYVGDYENEKVEANIGRYGPYIRYNKIFIPIPEGFNPFTITLDKSIELIEAKKAAQKPLLTYKSHDVTKGRGRFGPYLKWNNTFINVNSKYDFDSLTEQDCIELIEEKIKKDKEKILVNWESDQITIEKGRWGKIYIIKGKKRVPLSKNVDPLKISINDAKDILKIKK